MDVSKLNIPTLDGPNWGLYYIALQVAGRILDIWDTMRWETLQTTPPTFDLLVKPILVAANATTAEITAYTAAKSVWSKENAQGLGLIQVMVSPVIWQDYNTLGTAKEVLDALETVFGAMGGSINVPPIGQYSDNSIHWFDRSVTSDPGVPG